MIRDTTFKRPELAEHLDVLIWHLNRAIDSPTSLGTLDLENIEKASTFLDEQFLAPARRRNKLSKLKGEKLKEELIREIHESLDVLDCQNRYLPIPELSEVLNKVEDFNFWLTTSSKKAKIMLIVLTTLRFVNDKKAGKNPTVPIETFRILIKILTAFEKWVDLHMIG